jgi:hypothetical protein
MAIDRDGDGPPLRREDATRTTKPPADGLRASPFTEDVFDDEYYGRRPRSSGLSFSTIVGVVFFAAVVAAAGWYILSERSTPATVAGGDGELVRADPTPYKVKPEDPGGLQVANQDKLIYDDRLGKGPPPKHVENLLPAPEEPRAPPVKAPEPKVAPKAEPKAEAKPEPKAEAQAEAKPEAAKPAEKAVPAPESKSEAKAEAKPEPKPEKAEAKAAPKAASADPMADLMAKVEGMRKPEETTPPPQPAAPAANSPMLLVPATGNPPAPERPAPEQPAQVASAVPPAASAPAADRIVAGQVPVAGAIYVQLASAPSADGAMSEWKRLSSKYSDLLADLAPSVAQAEIPGKGTMYRLRAGPISERTAAQDLCGNLIARGLRCLIVKP